jgi:hypothetical protein
MGDSRKASALMQQYINAAMAQNVSKSSVYSWMRHPGNRLVCGLVRIRNLQPRHVDVRHPGSECTLAGDGAPRPAWPWILGASSPLVSHPHHCMDARAAPR